jgi:hypothetical protein
MSESKFHTYNFTVTLGSLPEFTDWWTDEDYAEHERYVEKLKQSGDYGKKVEMLLTVRDCPEFDQPKVQPDINQYRLIFLNFNE